MLGLGAKHICRMVESNEGEFAAFIGNKYLIVRREFEKYMDGLTNNLSYPKKGLIIILEYYIIYLMKKGGLIMDNYESNLFKTANKMRGKIPPSDYKFYVLPLVFLRYISLKTKKKVWGDLVKHCEEENIVEILDKELCKELPRFSDLTNPYENIYGDSNLPPRTIRDLICLINEINLEDENKVDYLGNIYEYFIGNFAATEGNRGGEFFTPASVVDLLVNMLEPQKGIVYDPACGTGGMFIQSNKYSGVPLKFVGQEQNSKTIMLAYMNAVLHGIDIDIKMGDTLLNDCYSDLKADIVISNPPFNMKDWGAEFVSYDDPRLIGKINKNNANYMWIQHFLYHMKEDGKAGFVISNGALTSSNEADYYTRMRMIELNVIDCVVQLPEKMFLGTAIPSTLIFLNNNRDKRDKILFIDASKLGELISKTQKVITKSDIERISSLYHSFRDGKRKKYNEKGFSWAADIETVQKNEFKLMPSLYTGVEEQVIDQNDNLKQIETLKNLLCQQIKISNKLGKQITEELIG